MMDGTFHPDKLLVDRSNFDRVVNRFESAHSGEYMSSSSTNTVKSPLDAAKVIVAELDGMPPEHQLLALKFAVETLGLQFPTAFVSKAPPVQSAHVISHENVANSANHSTDIRSFTTMKAPKSDQQFTAVVAYFYQFEAKPDQRKNAIDPETMKEAARLAGRPQVERWAMTLTNAKNAGYLDAAGGGKFKLSSVGENLVAITLPGSSGQEQGKRSRTSKKPKKKPSQKNARKSG
jgi:hypothetical protein